jgi:protein SCO1
MFLFAILFSFSSIARETPAYNGEPRPLVAEARPEKLEGVKIEEKLNSQLDMNLHFKNETGEEVTLGSFFDGQTPVIISPVYFSCPGLCNFHLNGLTEGLKAMDWSIGGKFKVLSISFDHRETPDLAAKKKETYMKVYNRPGTESSWHFLTADEATIKAFTSSIGFNFRWNEKEKEWAHGSAAVVASPKGTVSRYLPGIMFDPKDIKFAVLEAGKGKVGSLVDQLILYCFQYNPHQSKYTLYASRVMKAGGGLMVLILAIWLLPIWYRARRHPSSVRSS